VGEIYRKSSQVCIWLGEASENSGPPMQLINSIEKSYISARRELLDGKLTSREIFESFARLLLEDEQLVSHFRTLLSLICCPWFNRMWVFQEVVLAATRTVFCGKQAADWELLRRTSTLLFLDELSTSSLGSSAHNSSRMIFRHLPEKIDGGWRQVVTMLVRLSAMRVHGQERPPPLRILLPALRGRGMINEMYTVYAVLSLASDVSARD